MLSVRQDDWMWVDAARAACMHHGGPLLWDGRIGAERLFRKLPLLAHHEGAQRSTCVCIDVLCVVPCVCVRAGGV